MIALLALLGADPLAASPPEPAVAMDSETTLSAYLRCLDEADVTLVSGHRGGPEPGFPENAVETFANTLSQGPFLLEVDVRRTADGVFVLMHDETLERTTTGTGRVDETDWAAMQTYRLIDNDGAVTAFRPPSLSEALAWAEGRAMLQLDVKSGVDIAALTRFVAASGARPRRRGRLYRGGRPGGGRRRSARLDIGGDHRRRAPAGVNRRRAG
jgi:glycerophosphoryl diester phosphodiesterase